MDENFENHMNILKNQYQTLDHELRDIKRTSELPILKFGSAKTTEFLKYLRAAFLKIEMRN